MDSPPKKTEATMTTTDELATASVSPLTPDKEASRTQTSSLTLKARSSRRNDDDDTLRGVPEQMPEFDAETQQSDFNWQYLQRLQTQEQRQQHNKQQQKNQKETESCEKADGSRSERDGGKESLERSNK